MISTTALRRRPALFLVSLLLASMLLLLSPTPTAAQTITIPSSSPIAIPPEPTVVSPSSYNNNPFSHIPPEHSSSATHKNTIFSPVHIVVGTLIAVCVLLSIIAVARVLVLGGTFGKKYTVDYKPDIEKGQAVTKEREGGQPPYALPTMASYYYDAGAVPPPPYQERADEEENHGLCRRMCECCCVCIALNPISRGLAAIYSYFQSCVGGTGSCLLCFLLCR